MLSKESIMSGIILARFLEKRGMSTVREPLSMVDMLQDRVSHLIDNPEINNISEIEMMEGDLKELADEFIKLYNADAGNLEEAEVGITPLTSAHTHTMNDLSKAFADRTIAAIEMYREIGLPLINELKQNIEGRLDNAGKVSVRPFKAIWIGYSPDLMNTVFEVGRNILPEGVEFGGNRTKLASALITHIEGFYTPNTDMCPVEAIRRMDQTKEFGILDKVNSYYKTLTGHDFNVILDEYAERGLGFLDDLVKEGGYHIPIYYALYLLFSELTEHAGFTSGLTLEENRNWANINRIAFGHKFIREVFDYVGEVERGRIVSERTPNIDSITIRGVMSESELPEVHIIKENVDRLKVHKSKDGEGSLELSDKDAMTYEMIEDYILTKISKRGVLAIEDSEIYTCLSHPVGNSSPEELRDSFWAYVLKTVNEWKLLEETSPSIEYDKVLQSDRRRVLEESVNKAWDEVILEGHWLDVAKQITVGYDTLEYSDRPYKELSSAIGDFMSPDGTFDITSYCIEVVGNYVFPGTGLLRFMYQVNQHAGFEGDNDTPLSDIVLDVALDGIMLFLREQWSTKHLF